MVIISVCLVVDQAAYVFVLVVDLWWYARYQRSRLRDFGLGCKRRHSFSWKDHSWMSTATTQSERRWRTITRRSLLAVSHFSSAHSTTSNYPFSQVRLTISLCGYFRSTGWHANGTIGQTFLNMSWRCWTISPPNCTQCHNSVQRSTFSISARNSPRPIRIMCPNQNTGRYVSFAHRSTA